MTCEHSRNIMCKIKNNLPHFLSTVAHRYHNIHKTFPIKNKISAYTSIFFSLQWVQCHLYLKAEYMFVLVLPTFWLIHCSIQFWDSKKRLKYTIFSKDILQRMNLLCHIFNKEILQRTSLLCQYIIKSLNFCYQLHSGDACNYCNCSLKTYSLIL